MDDHSKDPLSSQREAVEKLLARHKLRHGVGDTKSMCTVAAINLALTGEVTDALPDCMSPVLYGWVIPVQDELPLDRLRSPAWTDTVPLAAGTNDGRDVERLALIMDWMWDTVLPQFQPLADKSGFGAEWRRMCEEHTAEEAVGSRVGGSVFVERSKSQSAKHAEAIARRAARAARAADQSERAGEAADQYELAWDAANWSALASTLAAYGNPAFWDAVDAEGMFRRLCCLPEGIQ